MVLFCTREAKMSSRILGVVLSPLSVFPPEEFKRFLKKPVLLLLTGVSIALLNVCRAAAGLAKPGSVWRGLFSFFGIGTRSFSLFSLFTFPLVRFDNQLNEGGVFTEALCLLPIADFTGGSCVVTWGLRTKLLC